MKKRGLLATMTAALLAAAPAMAAQPACSNVNAIINPGNQTVQEVSVVNGARVPTVVTLDATNSNPKGLVTCVWTSLDTPQIAITNPTSCTASITVPEVGPLGQGFLFRVKVTSAETGCSDRTDTKNTTITVTNVITNRAPVASAVVAGATTPYSVTEGTVVTLDGSGSSDPDGDSLTYAWEQIIDPNNPTTAVTIAADSTGKFATFTAPPETYPNGETLKFRLTVSDGSLSNSTEILVSVQSVNQAPVASIVCPAPVNEGAQVTLGSDGSYDPDAGPLTYQWSQLQGIPNADLSTVNLTGASITFTAPALTSYPYDTMKFGLTVTDNGKLSSAAGCDVKILDVTPPVISATADITKEATSASGATATFEPTAHDAFYGDVTVTCDPASGSTFPLGATPVKCTASDMATPPNTAEASFKVTVVDTTPPVIAAHPDETAEATSKAGAAVTYTSPATSDAVDGPGKANCLPASGSTFGFGDTTVTCNASDKAGNASIPTTFKVTVVDTTPPALTLPGTMGPIEGNTLGGATAAYTATASDLVDGTVGVTCDKASGSVFPVGTTTVKCSAVDAHNNTATGSFQVIVQDTTAPVIAFAAPVIASAASIGEGSSFYFGSVPAPPTCSANDVVSGAVPCTVAGYSTSVGTHTLAATATDGAGNKATSTISYTVLPWTLKGFYSPVDKSGVTNTVKGGSTVPLKFEVFVGTTELTTTSSISSIQTQSISCAFVSSSEDPVDALATGSTALRYDTTAGQFIFNWQTPKLPGACYVVTATTLDGSQISANFKLK